jgi:hypothetical protein
MLVAHGFPAPNVVNDLRRSLQERFENRAVRGSAVVTLLATLAAKRTTLRSIGAEGHFFPNGVHRKTAVQDGRGVRETSPSGLGRTQMPFGWLRGWDETRQEPSGP